MSYVKTTNFTVKDTYLTGNPAKVIKGSEIDVEFDNIANASALAVEGPAVAIDNEIPRFDGTTGKLVKAGLTYQSSPDDPAIGRVLLNGAWGIGASAIKQEGAGFNCDNIVTTGFYTINPSTLNGPLVGTSGGALIVVQRNVINYVQFFINADQIFTRSFITGAWGQWVRLFTSGSVNIITAATGSIGYGTGSGGTVTQATSKSTAVTLNKPSGKITMNGAALGASTAVSFTLTNSSIAVTDTPVVVISSGATAGAYALQVDAVAAGSCRISIRNLTGGSLSEAIALQFNIIKGSTA